MPAARPFTRTNCSHAARATEGGSSPHAPPPASPSTSPSHYHHTYHTITHTACAAGVSAATSKVCAERKGRDVYVVGAANVGKSAFVRAMLKVRAREGLARVCVPPPRYYRH